MRSARFQSAAVAVRRAAERMDRPEAGPAAPRVPLPEVGNRPEVRSDRRAVSATARLASARAANHPAVQSDRPALSAAVPPARATPAEGRHQVRMDPPPGSPPGSRVTGAGRANEQTDPRLAAR